MNTVYHVLSRRINTCLWRGLCKVEILYKFVYVGECLNKWKNKKGGWGLSGGKMLKRTQAYNILSVLEDLEYRDYMFPQGFSSDVDCQIPLLTARFRSSRTFFLDQINSIWENWMHFVWKQCLWWWEVVKDVFVTLPPGWSRAAHGVGSGTARKM